MYTLTIKGTKNYYKRLTFATAQEVHNYINTHWEDNKEYWITTPYNPIAFEIRDNPIF